MSQDPDRAGHILFLSGEPNSKGHIYRVLNRVEALIGTGWKTSVFTDPDDILQPHLEQASLLWVFRKSYNVSLSALYSRARDHHCPILYDIDDLIFDPKRSDGRFIRYLETINRERREKWQARVPAYQKGLLEADFACFPTQTLADEARLMGAETYVLRNGLDSEQLDVAAAVKKRERNDRIVIGYASGSPSHHHDFLEVIFPLIDVLKTRKQVYFTRTGHLDLSLYPALSSFSGRVREEGSVPYEKLPSVLAGYDINLAPLEWDNPFSHGKSELKFFEAAIVGCPTVAMATQPFSDSIINGETGFLARDGRDWYEALMTLIDNPELRKTMGQAARAAALSKFGPQQQKDDLLRLLNQVARHVT